jgi:hypothetical protein
VNFLTAAATIAAAVIALTIMLRAALRRFVNRDRDLGVLSASWINTHVGHRSEPEDR